MNKKSSFQIQIKSLIHKGIKYDIKDTNELNNINTITLKNYAKPFLQNKVYNNLSFKKLTLIIRGDHQLRSHVLNALKEIELDIDTYISNVIMNKYGRFTYLNITTWANIHSFKNRNKLLHFQKDMRERIKKECRNSSQPVTKDELNSEGYPSIALATYNFQFGDMVIFIRHLSYDNQHTFTKYYHCTYKELISWLECLRNVRNICCHKGVLVDLNLKKDLSLKKNLKLHDWPKCPKMFKNLIYNKNPYSIASIIFMIKYLMLIINPEYDFSPIKHIITDIINSKSLCGSDKDLIIHTLGFKNLKSLRGLLMNSIQFRGSINHNLIYSENNPYIKNKKFLYTKYLLKYLKYAALLRNKSLSKISSTQLGKDGKPYTRYYITSTIKTDSPLFVYNFLSKLAKLFGINVDILESILFNGNYNYVKKIKNQYIHQQVTAHNFKSTYHHNYIWGLCTKRDLPPKLIAKRLSKLIGKRLSTEDVRLCIESSSKPNLKTIIRMAYILNIRPYDLAKHFGYDKESTIHKINIIHKLNKDEPKYRINKFIMSLMKEYNLTQQKLAHKLGYKQTAISQWKYGRLPSLNNLINLSKIFNIKTIIFLQKHPYYEDIQLSSPAYKLIILCKKENIKLTKKSFKEYFGNLSKDCDEIIQSSRKENNLTDWFIAKYLINRFNLPNNYFGKTYNKRFNEYKENNLKRMKGMSNKDIGYRLTYIITLNHYTLTAIGKKIGFTKEYVRQLTLKKGSSISNKNLKKLLSIIKSTRQRKYLLGNIHLSQQLGLFN